MELNRGSYGDSPIGARRLPGFQLFQFSSYGAGLLLVFLALFIGAGGVGSAMAVAVGNTLWASDGSPLGRSQYAPEETKPAASAFVRRIRFGFV